MAQRPSTIDLIRREAQRLFAERGYASVSMREIAEAVGIRAGGLYNHFPTKQAILRDLMVGHLERLIAAWDVADRPDTPAADRLTAFAAFHVRFHFEKPDAVFIAYMELRSLEPENFAAVSTLRAAYEGRLRAIVADGAFPVGDAAVAARALIAMLTGVTTWYRPGGRLSIAEIEAIYIDMARRSVGLDARPAAAPRNGRTECSTAA